MHPPKCLIPVQMLLCYVAAHWRQTRGDEELSIRKEVLASYRWCEFPDPFPALQGLLCSLPKVSNCYPEGNDTETGNYKLCWLRGFWSLLTVASVFSKLQDRKGATDVLEKAQFSASATAHKHSVFFMPQLLSSM